MNTQSLSHMVTPNTLSHADSHALTPTHTLLNTLRHLHRLTQTHKRTHTPFQSHTLSMSRTFTYLHTPTHTYTNLLTHTKHTCTHPPVLMTMVPSLTQVHTQPRTLIHNFKMSHTLLQGQEHTLTHYDGHACTTKHIHTHNPTLTPSLSETPSHSNPL